MKKESPKYAQSTLFLRLLAGGYLVYTAWGLREAIGENPLFLIAMVAFGVIGAILVGHSGLKLWKGEYEGGRADVMPDEAEAETEPEETDN